MSVDSRVVDLKFNYSSFADGVSAVLRGVSQLAKGLQLTGATKGIADVQASVGKTNFNPMLSGLSQVTNGFSVMQVAGVTALATIVNKAVSAGAEMVKSLSVTPIMDGFREYELKMGSIQTILANTSRHGTTLETVNSELDQLNKYADKTIYNFAEMTKNASLFTNSGMKIEDATQVIKGFSNAAAASGTDANGAARAAYQLSQAFNTGTIRLMDWRSLTNAGMGSKNMQDSLIKIADGMGMFNGETTTATAATKDFNGSLEKNWLSADVMSSYLRIMAGDMTDAEMASLGLDKAAQTALKAEAKMAEEAATKVRTLSQLMGTIKEAVASGWTDTFELLFGDFTEATDMFTKVNDVVSKFVGGMTDARNKVLGDWKALGGRTVLIEGIKNAFQALVGILKPVKDAFRQIFPAKTGADLFAMTQKFTEFTEKLKMGAETTEKVKRIFAGLFAAFSIVGQILGGAIGLIGRFFNALSGGSGGLLNLGAGIGMFLVNLDLMMKKTGIVKTVFSKIGDVLAIPLKALGALGKAFASLFDNFDLGGVSKIGAAFGAVGDRLSPLQAIGERLRGMFSALGGIVKSAMGKIGEALSGIGDVIANAFQSADYGKVLDTLNVGLFAAIVFALKKFMAGGINVNVGEGLFGGITETLGGVTKALGTMQATLKSDMLLKIAGAIALLAGSLVVLSMVDSGDLTKALVAMSAGFVTMAAALAYLSTNTTLLGAIKMGPIAASLVVLSAALMGIALAMKIMATMSWEDITQALVGIGGSLTVIALAMRLMPKNMMAQSVSIGLLAVSLMALAGAVKIFAAIETSAVASGLVKIGAALVVLAAGMRLMPKNMLVQAVSLTVLGGALLVIAAAVKVFATMSLGDIGQGLLAIGGALVIIAAAMSIMPPTMILLGPALLVVAAALVVISGALAIMGGQSIGEMAIGLTTLAGALTILAVGLTAMSLALPGAAALVVAAGALMLLTPVLITLGTLDIMTIVTGLGALAAIFAVFGIAGMLLAPVVPVILALAAAIVLVGAGMALAGVGVLAFASAFSIAVALGAAGVKVLGDILGTFISAIPAALAAFGKGIVAFAKVIASAGKAFFDAFTTILSSIIKAIMANLPKIGALFQQLVSTALRILTTSIPQMVSAGMRIILGVLQGINQNIDKIIPVAVSITVKFINGVAKGLPAIIDAGVKLVIAFVNGVSRAIEANSAAMGAAGGRLGVAIVQGMARGIAGGLSVVTQAAGQLALSALNKAKSVLGIKSPSKEFEKIGKFSGEGFVKGLTGSQDDVKKSFNTMNDLLKEAMKAAEKDVGEHTKKLKDLNEQKMKIQRDYSARVRAITSKDKRDAQDARKLKDIQEELTVVRNKNREAIRLETLALIQSTKERHLAGVAHRELTTKMNDEEKQLESLAIRYDRYTDQIKEADKALEDSIKTRDDYNASVTKQYSDMPDVSKETKLVDYIDGLEAKIADTQAFATAIQQLRTLGLGDELYKELLAKGLDALPFVTELLAGGKSAVDEVSTLSATLGKAAQGLGTEASKQLYQAGVDAAQGLVNGLKSQQAAIDKQMQTIANAMVVTLKKKLQIKSPSREFAKIGVFSVKGLAKGLADTRIIDRASADLGNAALSGLGKSLAQLGAALDGEIDMNPTITPVLDLSTLQRDASRMNTLFAAQAIAADVSFGQASSISAAQAAAQSATPAPAPAPVVHKEIKLEQNNYSPVALSPVKIYRQTKNLTALAKEALNA